MRKLSILLSIVVILSFSLAACGGATEQPTQAVVETPSLATELPNTGVTEVATTEAPLVTATEAPTLAATETTGVLITETPAVAETAMPSPGAVGTPGAALPPLGFVDPSRLTTLMTFDVRNANGDTLATVDDMVIDLGRSQVLHVILAAGGFLGIGESLIPVPWNVLQVNPDCVTATMGGTSGGTGTTTGGAAAMSTPAAGGTGMGTGADTCYFLLNVDDETLRNAPTVDLNNLPDINTPGWDAEFNTYWETASGTGGTTSGAATTATPGTGTTSSTATPTTSGTTGGTGARTASPMILASDLLGMTVTAGTAGAGGTGSTAGGTTGGAAVTGTPAAGGTSGTTGGTAVGTATPGTGVIIGQGEALGIVTDAIVDLQTGDIRYLLVTVDSATLGTTGSLIPIPAQAFQIAGETPSQVLALNADPSVLSGAPAYEEGTFPNATAPGWDSELNTYWESQGFTTTTSP